VTQTEIIFWSVFGFIYACLLLWFIKVLLRGGPKPLAWRRFSIGFYVERQPKDEET